MKTCRLVAVVNEVFYIWLADLTAKPNTLHYANAFISLWLMSSAVNTRMHAEVPAATGWCCYGCCIAPRDNEERGVRDKARILRKMNLTFMMSWWGGGWGHVGTYESVMTLDYICVCVFASIVEVWALSWRKVITQGGTTTPDHTLPPSFYLLEIHNVEIYMIISILVDTAH